MPLYEYQCDACGHRFEVIQKLADAPIEICPTCGGPVHKLQSAPAFQFKGTGWYVTDYAKKDQPSGASKSDGNATDGGKASADKSEKTDKTESKGTESSKSTSSSESSTSSTTTSASSTSKP